MSGVTPKGGGAPIFNLASITESAPGITRAESVANSLKTAFDSGQISVGDRIGTKRDLQQRFGVAMATVNEAVRLLETQGLLTTRPGPGGGLFAAAPTGRVRMSHILVGFKWGADTLRDCLEVRETLEPMLMVDVSQHIRPAQLRDVRAKLDDMLQCAGDPDAYLRSAWAMHRTLAEPAQNRVSKAMYLAVFDYMNEGLVSVDPAGFDALADHAIHAALVDAIASRDADSVRNAVRAHSSTLAESAPRKRHR